jgi:predicted transcriptional regulator YheO
MVRELDEYGLFSTRKAFKNVRQMTRISFELRVAAER